MTNAIDKELLEQSVKPASPETILSADAIVMVEAKALKLCNRRLRHRGAKVLKKLIRSVKQFGIVRPILIDQHFNVIDGHGILDAAVELDVEQVPAIVMEHLSQADIKALGIALNKLQELGKWDDEALRDELELVLELDDDYDLELTGLETGEIEVLFMPDDVANPEIPDPSDNLPVDTLNPDYRAVSRLGDLFIIKGESGEHRVFCGDSSSKSAVKQAIGDCVVTMVITDPPFDVPIQGHVGGLGNTKHREFIMGSGELGPERFYKLLYKSIKRMKSSVQDGSLIYLFMDKNGLEALLRAGREAGLKLHSICIWAKQNGGMGSLYRSQHEFVVILKKGKAPHTNNVELGKYGRYRTTVWEYAGFNSFSKERQKLFHLHPTLKPVQMLGDAICDVTKRGEVVLDSFAGAGSTLIASEKMGRWSVSIELDPIYVDTILMRYRQEFGVEAIHAENGLSFSELARVREAETVAEQASETHSDINGLNASTQQSTTTPVRKRTRPTKPAKSVQMSDNCHEEA